MYNIITNKDIRETINQTYFGITARLTEARKAKGWTRYFLAKQTGLSNPTIAKFENHKTKPNIETIITIARALDVQLIITQNVGA